ncbi:hypothetical protein ACFL6M_07265 [Candidatus Eisenbacteria bacterium]|uniref:Uncharacterized protein n=1 Tax=Eiseniibacteriota bacterium TaxID=2212470 RepID=A0ABV6YM22_UNCEI
MEKKKLDKRTALEVIKNTMRYGSDEAGLEAQAQAARTEAAIAKAVKTGKIDYANLEPGDLDKIKYHDLVNRIHQIKLSSSEDTARKAEVQALVKRILSGDLDGKREIVVDDDGVGYRT